MRPQHLSRPAWVLGLTLLCIATLASSQAFGQTMFVKHTAVGTIDVGGLVFENSASEAKCTAAGISAGSAIVSTIIIDPNTADTNSDTAVGTYPTTYIEIVVGDGPVKLVASGMTRDGALATNYNNPLPPDIPFAVDGVAWYGSEPTTVTGPSFLGFDDSPPVGEVAGKGMLVGMGAFPGVLSDDSLPTTLTLTDWPLYKLIVVDLLDVDESDAKITVNATITSLTSEMVPNPSRPTPALSPPAVVGLAALLVGLGSVLVRSTARKRS